MTTTLDPELTELRRANAELQRRLDEALAERGEGEAQNLATAEVLQVINSSSGDLTSVFDAILEKALRLCEAAFGGLWIFGDRYVATAMRGIPQACADFLRGSTELPGPGTAAYRFFHGERSAIHNLDLANEEPYLTGKPARVALVDLGGARTAVQVPLRTGEAALGLMTIYRQEVRPFTERQIALLENFAAQAVIAMENARLITETREALEQQTATAEVLQVINSSPGDLAPVFDAMLEKAMRLCEAQFGFFMRYEGGDYEFAAGRGLNPEFAEYLSRMDQPGPNEANRRVAEGAPYVHIPDMKDDEPYRVGSPFRRAIVDLGGGRTGLGVPLRKDNDLLGTFNLVRYDVRSFSEKQIALVQNFAAQAVIAIENARLITETREALDQQIATSEVLQVINSSPGDLAPVFAAMLEKAMHLCGAAFGALQIDDGDRFRTAATHGVPAAFAEYRKHNAFVEGPGSLGARIRGGERVVHVLDLKDDEPYRAGDANRRALVDLGGGRTGLAVPLIKDAGVLGFLIIYRQEVRPFTEKQIALLQNFAGQAVIAIENARLITETREALEQQTATAEVLQVINSSPGDLAPVFNAMLEKAVRLCEASYGHLMTYDGEYMETVAVQGKQHLVEGLRQLGRIRSQPGSLGDRLSRGEHIGHIVDAADDESYRAGSAPRRAVVEAGIRTLLGIGLRKDGNLRGIIIVYREEVRPFTDKQIALLESFAAQAVVAMENARLIDEIRQARDEAEAALRNLQAAQANLIQAQKMAALGQLTAGIAHEIKNPLNFVNNFAGLSVELLDELKETAAPVIAKAGAEIRADIDETIGLLSGNLEKIAEHGKRADGIVKSMLEHSRGVTGERREVDLNNLVDEALTLAYHGARAQDPNFNISLERGFDAGLASIELSPQEITRVLLNLFSNGFYAATKRAREIGDRLFRPSLSVATREVGGAVEVRVRDNGVGIPPEIKDKLFQPFFTTKPTGEGTGLGLSISYEIVTQQHGGTIEVDSRVGEFTEFTIRLPRADRVTVASAG